MTGVACGAGTEFCLPFRITWDLDICFHSKGGISKYWVRVAVAEHQISNFSAVSWQEQITFAETMLMSALYYTNMLL